MTHYPIPMKVQERLPQVLGGPGGRALRAPIAGLADLVTREQVKSPALIVVGEVADEPEHSLRELALEIVK